jgi:hypothetical protein
VFLLADWGHCHYSPRRWRNRADMRSRVHPTPFFSVVMKGQAAVGSGELERRLACIVRPAHPGSAAVPSRWDAKLGRPLRRLEARLAVLRSSLDGGALRSSWTWDPVVTGTAGADGPCDLYRPARHRDDPRTLVPTAGMAALYLAITFAGNSRSGMAIQLPCFHLCQPLAGV